MSAAQPDIYDYLDFRRYLDDWFSWMKSRYPHYSQRGFARKADNVAPGLLASVISGARNLTPSTTQSFQKALALDRGAASFFEDLVALGQAETSRARDAAWEQVRATLQYRGARTIEGDSVQYLLHWYIPTIREFAACAGFRADPAWLASHLRPAITEGEAAAALDVLFSLGFLAREPDGTVVQSGGALVTPHEMASTAALHYHLGMLDRAKGALWATPRTHRHFLGVTAAVPPEVLPTLKRDLDQLQERLLARYDAVESERQVVYQINLCTFPLTERPESDEP